MALSTSFCDKGVHKVDEKNPAPFDRLPKIVLVFLFPRAFWGLIISLDLTASKLLSCNELTSTKSGCVFFFPGSTKPQHEWQMLFECQTPDTIGVFFVPFFSVFEIFQQRDLDVFDFFVDGYPGTG